MKYYCLILTAVLLLGKVSLTSAQDIEQALTQARAAYQCLENYHGKVITKSFSEKKPDQLIQTTRLTLYKNGDKFKYDLGSIKMLLNGDWLLNVNDDEQILACEKVNTQLILAEAMMPDLQEMIAYFSDISYKGITQNSHCYLLRSNAGPVELLEVYFDQDHHLLNKAVYHYAKEVEMGSSRVEMTCEHLDLNPQFEQTVFDLDEFVSFEDNQIIPQKKYRSYTLLLNQQDISMPK